MNRVHARSLFLVAASALAACTSRGDSDRTSTWTSTTSNPARSPSRASPRRTRTSRCRTRAA